MFTKSVNMKIREQMNDLNSICFTLDIDWASEYAIDKTLKFFNECNIPITVFLTHKSNVIKEYIEKNTIEAGIHPNFMPKSSQGDTFNEIIEYCMDILPNAHVMRCHRWFSVNEIYDIMKNKGIYYDSNECTLLDIVPPYIHRSGMLRIPVYFEDGSYILNKLDLNFKNIKDKYFDNMGLKVIDIHPMHFMINTPCFEYMRRIKDRLSYREWNKLDVEDIKRLRYNGTDGISCFIEDLVEFIIKKNIKLVSLETIYRDIMC